MFDKFKKFQSNPFIKKIFSNLVLLIISSIVFLLSSYWIVKNITLESLIPHKTKELEELSQTSVNEEDECGEGRKFEFKNGDIVEVLIPGVDDFVLKGDEIENMESISNISISPDQKKLCFIVHTIVPKWLYLYDLETGVLDKIDSASNCFWSWNTSYIAYNNHTTDVSPIDVLVYNMKTQKIINLTKNVGSVDWIAQCRNVSWLNDEDIILSCTETKTSDVSTIRNGKTYIFKAETGEILNVSDSQ